jgi:hypothetical protein
MVGHPAAGYRPTLVADCPRLNMWDWLFQFIDPLERAQVPYAIVGSVASSLYGEPRARNRTVSDS